MLLLILPENQSLGTDLRYSSVRLITPILGDHFRFVANSEVKPLFSCLNESIADVGGELLVQFAFPIQTFAAGNRSVFGADDILAWDTAERRIHRQAARELFAKCEAASP